MVANNPYVSLVIVTYNAGEGLTRCLRSLELQSSGDFECIVVDNGYADASTWSLFDVKYVRLDRNYGPSYARNYGVGLARGDIVGFIDDDAEVADDFVAVITRAFKDFDTVGIRGRIRPKSSGNIYNIIPGHYDLGDQIVEAPLITEGNCAVRRGQFLSAGGFNPALFGHEGFDLSYRLAGKGKQLYIPELVVYHDYVDNLGQLLRKHYRHGYNKRRFAERNEELTRYMRSFSDGAGAQREGMHRSDHFVRRLWLAVLTVAAESTGALSLRMRGTRCKGGEKAQNEA